MGCRAWRRENERFSICRALRLANLDSIANCRFKKWSGFLGHLLVVKLDGRLRWIACTKNSCNSVSHTLCTALFFPSPCWLLLY